MSSEIMPPLEFIDKMHDWMSGLIMPKEMYKQVAKEAWKYFQQSKYYATAQAPEGKKISSELLRCPFCNSTAYIHQSTGTELFYVSCLSDDCCEFHGGFETENAASNKWNTRTAAQHPKEIK